MLYFGHSDLFGGDFFVVVVCLSVCFAFYFVFMSAASTENKGPKWVGL